MAESKLTVGYWDIQALGHPTRLLLSYFGVPFEDKQYTFDNKEEWTATKPTLKTTLPNLPYIADGDIVLTESGAIIQYAALKTGNKDLLGKTPLDSIILAQYAGVLKDLSGFFSITWDKNFDTIKGDHMKNKVVPHLDKLSKSLGDKDYFLGYLTWVDFQFAYIFDILLRMSPETVKDYANLAKLHERIYSNEGIQKYRKSEKYPRHFMPKGAATWSGEETIQEKIRIRIQSGAEN